MPKLFLTFSALAICLMGFGRIAMAADGTVAVTVRPPDGVYKYVLRQGPLKVGESALTVHSAGALAVVDEIATVGELRAKITSKYDPATLNETSYVFDASGSVPNTRVTVTPTADGVNLASGVQSIDVQALKGAPMIVIGDNMLSSMFMVPSRGLATKASAFTMLLIAGGKAVPANMKFGTGTLLVSISGLDMKYTFDPATDVVEKVEIPAQDAVFTLVDRPHAP